MNSFKSGFPKSNCEYIFNVKNIVSCYVKPENLKYNENIKPAAISKNPCVNAVNSDFFPNVDKKSVPNKITQ